MSWRFATEFIRRFPNMFTLIQCHPGGGQYDCLSVITSDRHRKLILEVNREGGLHVFVNIRSGHPHDGSWADWLDRMCNGSAKIFLDEVTQEVGLPIPSINPPSTPEIIAYRFISNFLTHSIGTINNWRCINGFSDTSGYGEGVIRHFFSEFSIIPEMPQEEQFDSASQNYWFLCKNNKPLVCIDKNSNLYRKDGRSYNLSSMYHKSRKIWPLIFESISELLP